jgi:hypothetical protein
LPDDRIAIPRGCDLANNLRGMFVALRIGNGLPSAQCPDCLDPVEQDVYQMNVALHEEFNRLGVAHVWDDYGSGKHTYEYWQRSLKIAMENFSKVVASRPAPPAVFDFKSFKPHYSAFGWDVTLERPNREFSELVQAGATGFSLRGSGEATVVSDRYFKPGAQVPVTVTTQTGWGEQLLTADDQGRLSVAVPLGPPNADDQFSPQARTADTSCDLTKNFAVGSPGTAVYAAQVNFGVPVQSGRGAIATEQASSAERSPGLLARSATAGATGAGTRQLPATGSAPLTALTALLLLAVGLRWPADCAATRRRRDRRRGPDDRATRRSATRPRTCATLRAAAQSATLSRHSARRPGGAP